MDLKLQEIREARAKLLKKINEDTDANWYTDKFQEELKKQNIENDENVCRMEEEGALDDPIVNRDDAIAMYSRLKLGYEYTGMTKDGTHRKIWTLVDVNKDIVGTIITRTDKQHLKKNAKGPWDETFSYMNIIGWDESYDITKYTPKTAAYRFQYPHSKK